MELSELGTPVRRELALVELSRDTGMTLLDMGMVDQDLLAEATGEPVPSAEEIDERMKPKVSVAVDLPGPYVPGAAPSW